MLERVVGRKLLDNQPDVALFIGFVFTLIGFGTSFLIFRSSVSVAMIGLSSILIVPYILKVARPESPSYTSVFSRKNPSLLFFAFLFLGMALAYTILFGILAPDIRDSAFRNQLDVIGGRAFGSAGSFFDTALFAEIFTNNMMIVAIAVILSYFYGSGSIFVLNYNASIAGIVYGSPLAALLWGGYPLFANPILYLPHTILEIVGYLLAAVGGMVLTKPLTKVNTWPIERDAALLIGGAALLILLGALVEVTVPFWFWEAL